MERERRSVFWQTASTEDEEGKEGRNRDMAGATCASRQFQPSQQKDIADQWRREAMQDRHSPFSFTPFKQSSSAPQNTSDSPPSAVSSTLRRNTSAAGKTSVRVEGGRGVSPASSSAAGGREFSRTWGRPGGPRAVPAGSAAGRSASVMAQHNQPHSMTMGRPVSRSSEAALGISRYQSYCTLPRPEDLRAEDLGSQSVPPEMMSQFQLHPHQQLPLLPSLPTVPEATALPAGPNVFYIPFEMYQPPPPQPPSQSTLPKIVSRPPSSLVSAGGTMPHPPPLVDFAVRPPVHFSCAPAPGMVSDSEHGDIVSWKALQTLCLIHILMAAVIFCGGACRVYFGAKWAFGIEMLLGLLVMLAATLGLLATSRRSFHFATASFALFFFDAILAVPALLPGLTPWFAEHFETANPRWFTTENEPLVFDYCTSLMIGLDLLIICFTLGVGCWSAGNASLIISDLKSRLEQAETPPHKE